MTVDEMKLLKGQTESITISELRKRPGDVFLQVRMGKQFTIVRSGTPIALITQYEPSAAELGAGIRRMEGKL